MPSCVEFVLKPAIAVLLSALGMITIIASVVLNRVGVALSRAVKWQQQWHKPISRSSPNPSCSLAAE